MSGNFAARDTSSLDIDEDGAPVNLGGEKRLSRAGRLRGRDSNPNFLIQSQASYH